MVFGTFVPTTSANLTLTSDFSSLKLGDSVTLHIGITAEHETINAVAADVVFPSDMLTFVGSSDADSLINVWLEKPTLHDATTIRFSGITPGGFTAAGASIATLTFTVKKSGRGVFALAHTQLLRNDGSGTPVAVTEQSFQMTVVSNNTPAVIDTELPEHFMPGLVYDPDLFSGHAALVFTTTDKGSGIDHYEIKEGPFGTFVRAVSPYELKEQNLDSTILVKAVDRTGNERVEMLLPLHPHAPSPLWKIIGSIVVLCVLVLFYGYRRWWHALPR